MTPGDWIRAGHLTLPPDARLTGITRIQHLGLDHGPAFPLHFVVARDHHIATERIMLHRTERMPPADDVSVTPTAAFVAYCSEAITIDAIVVGDWLLREGHMSVSGLLALARFDDWRAGSAQAVTIAPHLDARSWSVEESRHRAAMKFAGLPKPDLNVEITAGGRVVAVADWAWLEWHTIAEYEGGHHQTDRRQYLRDIERYADIRDLQLRYVQLTKETGRNLVSSVRRVYDALVKGGYDGPPPDFGKRWRQLFTRIPAHPFPPQR
ncbi:hypothetical protein [Aeromicrobium sp. Leaf350]|uniref:hypothetical protein n=1 Tax=Aeromicrobium sp. Leaf350 TaxID=2876565 RepID=UPI001E5329AE|nr:hypothetical protein [Aeromicrobium sp. Leaf350]